jgi:general nucleoside transport system ATP-binding protein
MLRAVQGAPSQDGETTGPAGHTDPLVAMRGIVKHFGSVTALDGADFDLRAGEIHALLGENGAGKSTLMNILYGLERPDVGVIEIDGRPVEFRTPHDAIELGIGMVHQHFKLVPRLTVAENVILGGGEPRSVRLPDLGAVGEAVETLGEKYGLPISGGALVSELSVGEQQRVEIIRALYRGARILILDEPTATLTPIEADQLMEKLRRLAADGTAIVMITHHLDEVMASADRITVLRHGQFVGTAVPASTTQLDLARLMVGRDVQMLSEVAEGIDTPLEGTHAVGQPVLTITALHSSAAGRSGEGSSPARTFTDVNLVVREGEIVTIAGVEGNGQAELEDALLGLHHPASGTICLGDEDVTRAGARTLFEAGVGFIHSDRYRRGMIRELSIGHNLVYDRIDRPPFGNRFSLHPKAILRHGAELVQRYGIAAPSPLTLAGALSGGNAQKVVLARALDSDLRLLVAAQPTRGLDVGAIEFVWELLREERRKGLAILLITTDLNEVMALSDRCFVIYRGRLVETELQREKIGLAMGGAGTTDMTSSRP